MKQSLPVAFVDLFCGAGGLTHGLLKKGIQGKAGVDIDPACRFAYEANNGGAVLLDRDVESLTAEALASYFPQGNSSLQAGCAPCQPFSTYSTDKDTTKDAQWKVICSFSTTFRRVKTKLVTIE